MDGTKQIHFLLTEHLDGYVFNPALPGGLSFDDPKRDFKILIRSENESGSYYDGHNNLKIRSTVARSASQEQIDFVEALIDGRYLSAHGAIKKLPYILDGRELIDSSGKILNGYSPTWDMLPEDLCTLGKEVDRYLREKTIRFVQLLRWQQNAFGPPEILRETQPSPIIYWKTEHENYHLAPLPRQGDRIQLCDASGLHWGQDVHNGFAKLWASEAMREPLGHQLLREAKFIQNQNRRSALLIAYSALEVGLKQHICACVPDASWLAMHSPAPPISKILKDYLPQLHKENSNFQKWGKITNEIKTVRNFTEDRNRLAHRGEPLAGSLQDYLTLTENLLYAFDVLEGREWAKSRVSNNFRNTLGWN